jgi:cytochrome oxidase Cu insertion factor (SCO1/SenC/PrrC family)
MNSHAFQPAPRKLGVISRIAIEFAVSICVLAAPLLMAQAPPAAPGADAWKTKPAATTGLAVGAKIPAFELRDQNGNRQTFQSVRGPKGAAIYFMRSADW